MKTKPIQSIHISHELSNIGRLDFQLHGIAALFYQKLHSDGLIDYLKAIDHLGYISKCHPGNHHKRWDYVCLQLYFLQKLRHSAFSTGLNKDAKIDGLKASHQEILQTFILFANIGHLDGTVASEKGLFRFLEQNEELKAKFLSGINKIDELREFSDRIFGNFDFYKVKYLIALNYVIGQNLDSRILSAIRLILKKYLDEKKDIGFAKLRSLYFKIRKVSFVYLDSFHCSTPVQVNLSKILVNIFNYDNLFNPDDTDYDSILEACETVLSKELYVSPKSSMTFALSSDEFKKYLKRKAVGHANSNSVDYSNFLISLLKQKNSFKIKFPEFEKFHLFHFYLPKDALKIFNIHMGVNLDGIIIDVNSKEEDLRKFLNFGFRARPVRLTFQHDMRKSLFFFTVIIPKNLVEIDSKKLLLNFNDFFSTMIDLLIFNQFLGRLGLMEHPSIIALFYKNLRKDLIRRYFLYTLKLIFEKEVRLNLFIKFQYRQLINQMNSSSAGRLFETYYLGTKSELLSELDENLKKSLPEDIENNIHILKEIVETKVNLKGDFAAFVSIFPIEIEEMMYDAVELDRSGSPEKRRTITDIDAMLIVFQVGKYELYIVEGKKYKKSYGPACIRDLKKIRGMAQDPKIFDDPVLVESGKYKGGYLRIRVA